ncbi:pentapeptide repeat-containing protein [Sedimentitalea sp. JM2-8]|uniref:Pentapeptide repeat-containing protein n=1 Tax=Sedimentitalea xiamensis TaxID=3050037 RepID=A0ABT7FA98_9RHOB|nr:pentapeptide repeat-containing protein [Sedimentitalea xiamensis]MDK3072021.1 pentapeptide repeat-containing protein [Sedimentitalea xiamensis]
MPDAPDPVARIDALTANARNTWFALLGVLVFVGITLMGVQHIDFYGVDRATHLPLVNVEVPTRSFFVAGPILTAAIFGYFHLYLIRLWDALSVAPDRINDRPLGDAISPWLVTDAALHLRSALRRSACTTPRAMESPAMALNLALAWGFGLVVLGFLWWLSMPARTWWITAVAGLSLIVSLFVGAASLAMMILRMRKTHTGGSPRLWSNAPAMGAILVAFPAVLVIGLQRTTAGVAANLAPLNMIGASVVERPADWLPHYIARREFRAAWCRREQIADCTDLGDRAGEFDDEWNQRRAAERAALRQPHWSVPDPAPIDLRRANLSGAFLAGASLRGALLDNANLAGSQMEAVDLGGARMAGAILVEIRLEQADLRGALMQGANLQAANLVGATLAGASLAGANLLGARMQSADLNNADLTDADLRAVQLQGATLYDARLTGANLIAADLSGANLNESDLRHAALSGIRLDGASLSGADLRGADLNRARLTGANLDGAQLQGASLHRAKMDGTDVRRATLTGTDISGASLRDATFDHSLIAGTGSDQLSTTGTDFRGSRNRGGALRDVDLSLAQFDADSDWRTVFLDASVHVPDDLRALFGAPCQWAGQQGRDTPLSDAEFFARWRGWVEADPNYVEWSGWTFFAPPEWHDVAPVPPPDGCAWSAGQTPDRPPHIWD